MTPEQMMESLKAQGYNITAPKTKEQELQEQFDAKLAATLAEQDKKWEERIAQLLGNNNQQTTQRQTQSLAGNDDELKPDYITYQEGDYLKGTLHPKNWKKLADRRVPWPKDVDYDFALGELSQLIEYQMLEADATARGRLLREMIASGEVA